PRRSLTRQAVLRIPETRVRRAATERARAPIRDGVAVGRLVEAAHACDVTRVDEHVAHRLIDGDAAEVRTTLLSRKNDAILLRAVRRVGAEVVDAADLLHQLTAELLVRGFAGENLVRPDAEARQRRRLH